MGPIASWDGTDFTQRDPLVVAYGLGVNSTAMLVGLKNRGITVDAILFADTGSEKRKTMRYLPIIQDWLYRNGMPPVTILKNASPIAGDNSLHEECLRKSVLPSLAYGKHSCSIKWKLEPQTKFCRQAFSWNGRTKLFAHGPTIVKAVGYDAGPADARRIKKAQDVWPEGHINRYFLLEWGWDRQRCIDEIVAEGLEVPCKSACFMCPAAKKWEIDELDDEEPDHADIAVQMESRALQRGLRSIKGLGRNFSWTEYLRRD